MTNLGFRAPQATGSSPSAIITCVSSAAGLIVVAREAGISVFPGFEATVKDGVHVLCLFDPSTSLEMLGRYLGACGIHREADEVQPGELDTGELLERAHAWGAVTIAAHEQVQAAAELEESHAGDA